MSTLLVKKIPFEELKDELALNNYIAQLQNLISSEQSSDIDGPYDKKIDYRMRQDSINNFRKMLKEVHPDSRRSFAEEGLKFANGYLGDAIKKKAAIVNRIALGENKLTDKTSLKMLDIHIAEKTKLIENYTKNLLIIDEIESMQNENTLAMS